jgi:hypothetical protein
MHSTFIIAAARLTGDLLSPIFNKNAYLDPGSGSFILQLIIAGALGAIFAIRAYWSRIKSAFTKNKPSELENETEDN